jgi:hypothetical protein
MVFIHIREMAKLGITYPTTLYLIFLMKEMTKLEHSTSTHTETLGA